METLKFVASYAILILASELFSTFVRKAAKITEERWLKTSMLLWIMGYIPATMAFAIISASKQTPGLLVGPVIGSHVLNIAVIFPILYLSTSVPFFKVKTMASPFILLGAAVLATLTLLNGTISPGEGYCLLALIPIYFLLFFKKLSFEQKIYVDLSITAETLTSRFASVNVAFAGVAFAVTLAAAWFFHDGVAALMNDFHISGFKMGNHLVALLLSLPPFIRTYAVYQRNKKNFNPAALIVTGMTNSLIINLLLILGGSAALSNSLKIPELSANVDLSVFLSYSVLFAILLLTERLKTPALPVLMVAGYFLYSFARFL